MQALPVSPGGLRYRSISCSDLGEEGLIYETGSTA